MADNPRKLLYLSIYDKPSVLVGKGKLLRKVDRWNNQIDSEESEKAQITPSVLIQIENKFEAGSRASKYDLQSNEVIVTCHVGINIKGTHGIQTRDYDIFQGIYEQLQGECNINEEYIQSTPLDRIAEIEDNNYDGFYHGRVEFITRITDYSKNAARGLGTTELTLDSTVTKD